MRRLNPCVLALLLGLAACGGNDSTGPSNVGGSGSGGSGSGGVTLTNGSMSATIDGAAWNANVAILVSNIPGTGGSPGFFVLSAIDSSSRGIAFATQSTGTNTYTVAAGTTGLNFILTQGSQNWEASFGVAGTSGTVTFTALTASRATGTYSFTAVPTAGTGATGTKVVTNGAFNVTF